MKIVISENQLKKIFKLLKENPNYIKNDGETIANWYDDDALVFGLLNNKAYIGFCKKLAPNSPDVFGHDARKAYDRYGEYRYHDVIYKLYNELFNEDITFYKNDLNFPGRLWIDKKVISFWKYPSKNELKMVLNKLTAEIKRMYNYDIFFNDYIVEVGIDTTTNSSSKPGIEMTYELVPIDKYESSADASLAQMAKMHLLPPAEKRKSPQMQAALDSKFRQIGNKFGADRIKDYWDDDDIAAHKEKGDKFRNVTQAEYNHYKRYNMGDSVQPSDKPELVETDEFGMYPGLDGDGTYEEMYEDINLPVNTGDTILMGKFKNKKTVVNSIGKDEHNMPTINGKKAATFRIPNLTEISSSEVNLSSFETKKELNEKFWTNKKLNSKVRKRLLKIADDFLNDIKIDNKYCSDVIFLGSLANYNWSKYSDVDLHLIIDFKKVNKNIELVKDYFDVKRTLWNDTHESLKIYGFPIEIYIQDINEENSATGVFSLEKNKWIKIPKEIDEDVLNKTKIKQKSADLMTKIDKLKSQYDKKTLNTDLEKLSKNVKSLFDEIKRLRKSGLSTNKGEFSTGNIVFKVLRRSGRLETLIDLKRNTYDKINTIK